MQGGHVQRELSGGDRRRGPVRTVPDPVRVCVQRGPGRGRLLQVVVGRLEVSPDEGDGTRLLEGSVVSHNGAQLDMTECPYFVL